MPAPQLVHADALGKEKVPGRHGVQTGLVDARDEEALPAPQEVHELIPLMAW